MRTTPVVSNAVKHRVLQIVPRYVCYSKTTVFIPDILPLQVIDYLLQDPTDGTHCNCSNVSIMSTTLAVMCYVVTDQRHSRLQTT